MSTPRRTSDTWIVTGASARGKNHLDFNVPCQDYVDAKVSEDGTWLVVVVSDGAGTASRAAEGAYAFATGVTTALFDEATRGVIAPDRDAIERATVAAIASVRARLEATGTPLEDFHCTLVGALVGSEGGAFFHIGDGVALASKVTVEPGERDVRLWNELTLSEPENGEYYNETFFVTQDSWQGHLRFCSLPPDADVLLLMTDGAMPLVLPKLRPYGPFIDPLIAELSRIPDAHVRSETLRAYLESPGTFRITGDDKTLFIAIRSSLLHDDYTVVSSDPGESVLRPDDEAVALLSQAARTPWFARARGRAAIVTGSIAFVVGVALGALSTFAYSRSHASAVAPTPFASPSRSPSVSST